MSPRFRLARFPIVRPGRASGTLPVATVRLFAVVISAALLVVIGMFIYTHQLGDERYRQRVADQKKNDLHIAQLACGMAHFILSFHPKEKRTKDYADGLLRQYQCAKLHAPGRQSKPSATRRAAPAPTPTRATPVRSSLAAVVTRGVRPAHSPTPTHVAQSRTPVAPRPTRSPVAPAPPPTRVPSRPAPVLSVKVPVKVVPSLCVGAVLCIGH